MNAQTVTLTELKQHLGEYIKRAAFGKERIILVSHGQASAALISMADLRLLEEMSKGEEGLYVQNQEKLLREARVLRKEMAGEGYQVSTADLLDEVRGEPTDDLLGLR